MSEETQSGITLHSTMMITPSKDGYGYSIEYEDKSGGLLSIHGLTKEQCDEIVDNYKEKYTPKDHERDTRDR